MDHEQAFHKTIVSWVVRSMMLDGNSTLLDGNHLLSSKIDVMEGLPNPPSEGVLGLEQGRCDTSGTAAFFVMALKRPRHNARTMKSPTRFGRLVNDYFF
jgi:hypothetical protein